MSSTAIHGTSGQFRLNLAELAAAEGSSEGLQDDRQAFCPRKAKPIRRARQSAMRHPKAESVSEEVSRACHSRRKTGVHRGECSKACS